MARIDETSWEIWVAPETAVPRIESALPRFWLTWLRLATLDFMVEAMVQADASSRAVATFKPLEMWFWVSVRERCVACKFCRATMAP